MTINQHNYKEFLLDYVDNELSAYEQELLTEFINQHPEVEQELRLLQKTKLPKEEVPSFPNKDLLYRTESRVPKVLFPLWKKVAVAAAAAGILFGIWQYLEENGSHGSSSRIEKVVSTTGEERNRDSRSGNLEKEQQSYSAKKDSSVDPEPLLSSGPKQFSPSRMDPSTSAHSTSRSNPINHSDKGLPSVALSRSNQRTRISPLKGKVHINNSSMDLQNKENDFGIPSILPIDSTKESYINLLVHKKNISSRNVTNSLKKLKGHKESLDSTFTDKLFALQNKVAHPIKALNIKKIQIGNISFVFDK